MSKRAFSFISNFLPIYSITVEPLANTALGWANLAVFFGEVYSANMPIHFLQRLNTRAINNILFDRLEHADLDILTEETISHGEVDRHSPSMQVHTHTLYIHTPMYVHATVSRQGGVLLRPASSRLLLKSIIFSAAYPTTVSSPRFLVQRCARTWQTQQMSLLTRLYRLVSSSIQSSPYSSLESSPSSYPALRTTDFDTYAPSSCSTPSSTLLCRWLPCCRIINPLTPPFSIYHFRQ